MSERYCFVVAGRSTSPETIHDELRAIVDVLRQEFITRALQVEVTLHVKESADRVLGAVGAPEPREP